jgi:hypothetical protein
MIGAQGFGDCNWKGLAACAEDLRIGRTSRVCTDVSFFTVKGCGVQIRRSESADPLQSTCSIRSHSSSLTDTPI